MAVSHNSANADVLDSGTSISVPVVVVAGNNKVAMIGISWSPVVDAALDTVTFNSQSATFIQATSDGVAGFVEQYFVVGVTAGVKTAVVTFTIGHSDVVAIVGIEVLNDVKQTGTIGAKSTASGNTTSPSTLVSSLSADSLVVDTVTVDETVSLTSLAVGAGQTERWNLHAGVPPPLRYQGAASTEPSNGSSVTMSWLIGVARTWAIAAVEFLFEPPAPTVRLGGYTSYDYFDDPTPIESYRLEEVQQRIWAGDRRYMRDD